MKNPSSPRGRGIRHGNLRSALITAGFALLDEGGAEAVTIREIARRAGVAHSAPANHFRDRIDLLTCLAIEIFDALGRVLDAAIECKIRSQPERLRSAARAVLEFALAHPNRYRLIWRPECLTPADSRLEAAATAVYERVRVLLETKGAKRLRSADTWTIAAWSMIHGYISLRLGGVIVEKHDEVSGTRRSEAIIDALIDGLGIREEREADEG